MSGRLCCLGLHGVKELLELVLQTALQSPGGRGSSGSWSGTAAWRGSSSAPAPRHALVRPAVSLQEDPRALVAQQPQLRPLLEAALLLDTCSLLQPAQFFVVTVSVLEAKSCGAETVPELVTSPQTTLPVDTPPLVAVKVQSRLSQSSGPRRPLR